MDIAITLLITILRFPFGVLATGILILWTFAIAIIFFIGFCFCAVFGNQDTISSEIVPGFQNCEGTHLIPNVWEWVFNSDLGGS
jgi:uncharacterized BrkB/YihY/UPF0761 family membrane protein